LTTTPKLDIIPLPAKGTWHCIETLKGKFVYGKTR
jgi:hypothetical protein